MAAYYNENDPYAAEWLRNLIDEGLIAQGEVDDRSIKDVQANDLAGFRQCHFFAGVGAWSYALRRAGWSDDRPVWTGSCPCQPFSVIGTKKGVNDPRHLWPDWARLIGERKPVVVFGEQVASKDGLGWFDAVRTDMESMAYALGVVVTPAAGFGAPHQRHRTYFVGHAVGTRLEGHARAEHNGNEPGRLGPDAARPAAATGDAGVVADTDLAVDHASEQAVGRERLHEKCAGLDTATSGSWANADWIPCRDGSWRAIEPGTFPLANGPAARLDQLRAYGNALAVDQAAKFIESYREVING